MGSKNALASFSDARSLKARSIMVEKSLPFQRRAADNASHSRTTMQSAVIELSFLALRHVARTSHSSPLCCGCVLQCAADLTTELDTTCDSRTFYFHCEALTNEALVWTKQNYGLSFWASFAVRLACLLRWLMGPVDSRTLLDDDDEDEEDVSSCAVRVDVARL